MEDHRISVEARTVELVLTDGTRLTGEVFLQLYGQHQAGMQRVGEVLNDENNFLPLRTTEGVKLVNLTQIVMVSVPAETEFDPLLALGEEHRVRVTTSVGVTLDARIYVNLPSGSKRTKDFLDQKKRFLLFNVGEMVVYIARRKILLVEN